MAGAVAVLNTLSLRTPASIPPLTVFFWVERATVPNEVVAQLVATEQGEVNHNPQLFRSLRVVDEARKVRCVVCSEVPQCPAFRVAPDALQYANDVSNAPCRVSMNVR